MSGQRSPIDLFGGNTVWCRTEGRGVRLHVETPDGQSVEVVLPAYGAALLGHVIKDASDRLVAEYQTLRRLNDIAFDKKVARALGRLAGRGRL